MRGSEEHLWSGVTSSKSSRRGVPSSVSNCLSQPCLPVSNVGPTKILPFLFLGSQVDALCEETMKQNEITYVVNVSTSSPKPSFIQDGHFLRIPVNDTYSDRLIPFFKDAFQFLDKVREVNGSVLVHCLAGISRSATLAIAYVMSTQNLNADEAYRYVKEKRPTISPNFNFLGQLVEFEKDLARSRLVKQSIRPDVPTLLNCNAATTQQQLNEKFPNREKFLNRFSNKTIVDPKLPVTLTVTPMTLTPNHCVPEVLNSPTVALSKLTFSHLSPFEEQSSFFPNDGAPVEQTVNNSTQTIGTGGAAGVAAGGTNLSLPSSDGAGVIIRLGPKHQCAGTKRPLSSPAFGCELSVADQSEGAGGGSSMKQRRQLGRPNSIGVVPVGRPGENLVFGKPTWLPALSKEGDLKFDSGLNQDFGHTGDIVTVTSPSSDVINSVLSNDDSDRPATLLPMNLKYSEISLMSAPVQQSTSSTNLTSRPVTSGISVTSHSCAKQFIPSIAPFILHSPKDTAAVTQPVLHELDLNEIRGPKLWDNRDAVNCNFSDNIDSIALSETAKNWTKSRSLEDMVEPQGVLEQHENCLLKFCDARGRGIVRSGTPCSSALLSSPVGVRSVPGHVLRIGERNKTGGSPSRLNDLEPRSGTDSHNSSYGSMEMIQVL